MCDGLPYCLAHKLIHYAYDCLNCQDSVLGMERYKEHNKSERLKVRFLYTCTKGVRLMMYLFGLISSCTGPFLQTYPKMALSPPDRGTNFLNGDKKYASCAGKTPIGVEKCLQPQSGTASDFLAKMKINQFQ